MKVTDVEKARPKKSRIDIEHEISRICDMANIIRVADALDRTRFPIYSNDYLNTKFLTHSSSKELFFSFRISNLLNKFNKLLKIY